MKKEQYARLLHTQNISKQWNIALNMLRFRSEGFYQRQNCTDNNISLSSNYNSKSNRYSFLVNGIISSVKTDENGGVNDDTIFEENLFANKKLLSVNLSDARTRRGSREFTATQFLNFGRRDTANKDSTIRSKIIPGSYLSYSFHAGDNWFVYDDKHPTSGYYENIYFDSTRTRDSTRIFTMQNSISWKSFLVKNISAEISLEQKVSRLIQYSSDSLKATDSLFRDNIIHWGIGKNIRNKNANGFYWNTGGQYIVNGNHNGDYFISANLSYIFKNEKKISFTAENTLHSVPFIYSMYASNHFWWINPFDKISETNASICYHVSKNKFSFGAGERIINGYVYFDTTFFPKQFDATINIFSAFIAKKFHFGKFNFYNKITYQKSSYENILHIPQMFSNHSLYYEDNWFKGATHVQLGFDVMYSSSYYADAYMPALGLYYLQNKKQIGNYPYVDFFFNMKVKHARIFFKTEHVNSGLMGAYYLAPNFPAPDRAIKVGINWVFYD